MKPIINPLWFYLIDTITSLKVIVVALGLLLLLALIFISMLSSYTNDEFLNFWKTKGKKGLLPILFLIIFGCLIPGTETAYKMLIASFVTPDNVAAAGDSIYNIVDYIIESVDKLIESNQ